MNMNRAIQDNELSTACKNGRVMYEKGMEKIGNFGAADTSVIDSKEQIQERKGMLKQTCKEHDANETSSHGSCTDPSITDEEVSMVTTGFLQRQAQRIARSPWLHFGIALLLAVSLSTVGIIAGDFSVAVESDGWQTRGTMIANRLSQAFLLRRNQAYIQENGETGWDYLLNKYDGGDPPEGNGLEEEASRRLRTTTKEGKIGRQLFSSSFESMEFMRHLQESADNGTDTMLGDRCDLDVYKDDTLYKGSRLWPVWEAQDGQSILSPDVLYDICVAEENTKLILEEKELCFGCDHGCLPPLGVVLYAQLTVATGSHMLSCSELRDAWIPYQQPVEHQWKLCMIDIQYMEDPLKMELPESCPPLFTTFMVDKNFDVGAALKYTSSVYATIEADLDTLYEQVDRMDRGGRLARAAYDTQGEDFNRRYQDEVLVSDVALAFGSTVIVVFAILVHTRSIIITIVGLIQILFTFPMAYFVYRIVLGISYFPYLSFLGIFISFALGADDVFVAVDKWKNCRLDNPTASTENIAALALPDAAGAMFLTTLTTSIAFLATAICPVAPIKLFAIFTSTLVILDYINCVLFIFPILCICDRMDQLAKYQEQSTTTCSTQCGYHASRTTFNAPKESIIHVVLSAYYRTLHRHRWIGLVLCTIALGVSVMTATKLRTPDTLDVRLLDASNEYEQNYVWRQELLDSELQKAAGSTSYIFWGLEAADTGDQNDPNSKTRLVLDDTFSIGSEDSQLFMIDFCEGLFAQDFASRVSDDYQCPMASFNQWLQQQQSNNATNSSSAYDLHCDGQGHVPIHEDIFPACFVAWVTDSDTDQEVLLRGDTAQVMYMTFDVRVGYRSHFDELESEYHVINDWIQDQMDTMAPDGLKGGFFANLDFWWYDTHKAMMDTAYGSASISLGVSTLVILLSSRSITLAFVSAVTICYVLASVTATMVAFHWTMGFLESIAGSILIGISADFVTHFSHAYASPSGNVDRSKRTHFALIHMGPSVLAAAFTTVASAIIMLFTQILFFQKFAYVLFFSVVQATLGAFVFFSIIVDCAGPSHPTFLVDRICMYLSPKEAATWDETILESQDSSSTSHSLEASTHHTVS